MPRLFQLDEATAARRRFPVYLVDATDGITPETGEAGGQPQLSKNGAAFGNTSATLTGVGNGSYYVELTAGEVDTLAMLQIRYKSANTAEFSMDGQVVAFDPYDAVRAGLTALPDAAADAAGGLAISDAGGLDIDNRMPSAAAITNLNTLYDGVEGFSGAYAGPRGPGVYLNDAAANTSTANGVDGTWSNPVSTIAAAKTIADSLGVDRIYLVNDSSVTLAATMVDYEFVGVGELTGNVINLGSQDVTNSAFYNLNVQGTQGGSGRIVAIGCALQDPGAGATTLHIFACFCGIVDQIEVDTSNDNIFDQCYSLIAGTAAPIIIATGAAGTIAVRHYSGGIEFQSLSASHNVSVETDGQVIFAASCNVNATVALRGNLTITDNTAGMNSLTTDAVFDKRSDIASILADTNELQGDWADGGRLDLLLDAIKAVTDLLPDAGALTAIGTDTARLTAVRAAVLTDWIDAGRLDVILDAIKIVTDALPDAGALTTIAADAARLTAARAAVLTDWINGGRLDVLLDAIPTTVMRGTDGANTTTPPTAGAVADQVWDEAAADHVAAGSMGEALGAASAPTAAAVADAVWDEAVADHAGAGSTGEALAGASAPSAATVADAVWDEASADHVAAGTTGKVLADITGGAAVNITVEDTEISGGVTVT